MINRRKLWAALAGAACAPLAMKVSAEHVSPQVTQRLLAVSGVWVATPGPIPPDKGGADLRHARMRFLKPIA